MLNYTFVQASNVNITVDKRMELISIVQLISGYDMVGYYDTEYKKDALDYFSKHKDHISVKLFKQLKLYGSFEYHRPYAAMLYFTQPPKFDIKVSDLPEEKLVLSTEKELLNFIESLQSFYNESNFLKFYKEHQNLYNKYLDEFRKNIDVKELISLYKEFYGIKLNNYNIYLVPLANGGYNVRKNNMDGSIVLGISKKITGNYSFVRNKPVGLTEFMLLHEFSHSYLGEVTLKNLKLLNECKYLYEPISRDMQKYGYYSWYRAFNEHLINAISIRILTRKYGHSIVNTYLTSYKKRGYLYIEDIYKVLKKYENDRDKYKNFDEFFPELVQNFINKN